MAAIGDGRALDLMKPLNARHQERHHDLREGIPPRHRHTPRAGQLVYGRGKIGIWVLNPFGREPDMVCAKTANV